AAERKKLIHADAEIALGIIAEILLDERGRETVEARRHRRMRGEEIACARHYERHVEGNPRLPHQATRPLEHAERRVPFIEMADLGTKAELVEQAPPAYAEHHLLSQPQLLSAAVKLARDAAVERRIGR